VEEDLHHIGARSVDHVSTSQLYRLVGELASGERLRVGRELLCDPVVQEFHDGGFKTFASRESSRMGGSKSAVVDVWYKAGVTDVVGESVLKGLRDLHVSGITEVRTGTRYRFWGLKDSAAVERLALALLVNPLIQDHVIHPVD
jgi:phosphoribosylformylglycinamidine (FGAM) synthase PurS component